jgi:N,N'-diacetyllegionaminate synthase
MAEIATLRIGSRTVGYGRPVFVIAEAGVNHNGSIALAKALVDAARAAGADAVKFQNFAAEEVATERAKMAAYQKRNIGKSGSQISMIRKLELSAAAFAEIAQYCKKRGIIFLSTPHGGFASVDLLRRIGVPAIKIGSADLNNLPLLAYAARLRKPMIVSTGMAEMSDIAEAVAIIRKAGNKDIIALQCTTDYPVQNKDINLRAMLTIRDKHKVLVGYSDHSIGQESAVLAVALGACVLEKHLTLDNAMAGPDHRASANPRDFKAYVRAVRDAEIILGSPRKTIAKSARQYMPLVLKSVVARRPIKRGEPLTPGNLAIKRPGTGLAPKYYFEMLGRRAKRNIGTDALIRKADYA